MGYTHYWRRVQSASHDEYKTALAKAIEVVRKSRAPICADSDEPKGKPELGDGIFLNGRGDDGHETFYLPASAEDLEEFQFCKTARKPYDTVVVAALATMAHFAPGALIVSSDGGPSDWVAGCALASRILGEDIPVPIKFTD